MSVKTNVTFLIGPSGTGKSTYLKKLKHDFVVSSDEIVNQLCVRNRLTFEEFFSLSKNDPLRHVHAFKLKMLIKNSAKYNRVVWDLPNLTVKTRIKSRDAYGKSTLFHAVIFDWSENVEELLGRRADIECAAKQTTVSKYFPKDKLLGQLERCVIPTEAENFATIQHVNTFRIGADYTLGMAGRCESDARIGYYI
jgi:predicted kinase